MTLTRMLLAPGCDKLSCFNATLACEAASLDATLYCYVAALSYVPLVLGTDSCVGHVALAGPSVSG